MVCAVIMLLNHHTYHYQRRSHARTVGLHPQEVTKALDTFKEEALEARTAPKHDNRDSLNMNDIKKSNIISCILIAHTMRKNILNPKIMMCICHLSLSL